MTKTQGRVVVALLALVVGCLVLDLLLADRARPVYLSQPLELTREDAPAWEYRIESVPDLSWDTQMASIGADGWELVFARRAQGAMDQMLYEAIFRRQKRT